MIYIIGDMLGGFKSKSIDFLNVVIIVRNLLGVKEIIFFILIENYIIVSLLVSIVVYDYYFNMKILDYIFILVGCLLVIVVLYCVVSRFKFYLLI